MQEVLVSRGQLAAQQLLEAFDDFGMAFHAGVSCGAGGQCAGTGAGMFQSESVAVAAAFAGDSRRRAALTDEFHAQMVAACLRRAVAGDPGPGWRDLAAAARQPAAARRRADSAGTV